MLQDETKDRILKQLESMTFEEARRKILYCNLGYEPNSESHEFCISWLETKESERRDGREEETLKIARNALSDARLATRIAISAIILSIIMAIFTVIN